MHAYKGTQKLLMLSSLHIKTDSLSICVDSDENSVDPNEAS